MAIPDSICIPLPHLSAELPNVKLPLGAELSAVVDFANGLPTDCTVALNLFGQVNVALGNVQCLITLFDTIQKLAAVIGGLPTPSPSDISAFVDDVAKLADCFASITPAGIVITIKDVIEAIIRILTCLISEIESIINFRVRLNVGLAVNNPKLAAILICANENANTSAASMLKTLEPITKILELLSSLPGGSALPKLPSSASLNLQTPSLSDIVDTGPLQDFVQVLKDIVGPLQAIADAIPG